MRLADESHECAFRVHYRQRPGLCLVECEQYHIHRVVDIQAGRRLAHELADLKAVVQFLSEHNGAHVVQIDNAYQAVLAVYYGEYIAPRGRDALNQFAQVHVGIKVLVILLDHGVHAHQREYGMVFMVGEQLSFFGQPHGIDAVRFKGYDGQIGAYGYNHQGHEQLVSSRQFGYEKDACQGRVHHTAHQSGHAQHGEIAFGQVDTQGLVEVPKAGENESRDTS